MIFKVSLVLKGDALRDIALEADVIVNDDEEARAAGEEFMRLASEIGGGMDAWAAGRR